MNSLTNNNVLDIVKFMKFQCQGDVERIMYIVMALLCMCDITVMDENISW